MNKPMASMTLVLAAFAVSFCSYSRAEVPLDVHAVSVVTNDVPPGTTRALPDNALLTERTTVLKTGGGAAIAAASATGPVPLRLQVKEGRVVYTDDMATASTVVSDLSDAVKAKLAFWVSAKDRTHIVSTNGVEIERWYDVRETNTEAPTRLYLQALHTDNKPGPSLATARYVCKYGSSTNEMEMVSFGGYGSGQSLKVLQANGSAYKTRPMELSAVYGRLDANVTFGYLYGNCMSTSEHTLWCEGTGLPWDSAWAPSAGDTCIWIDGLTVPRDGRDLPYGFHALHTRYNTLMTENLNGFENAIFSTTASTASRGGAYVGEFLVFSNVLTHAERLEVQRYVDRKWFGRRSATGKVALEEGTRMELSSDGTETADVQATGDGAVVKTGDGKLVYCPKTFENALPAAVTLEGGSVEVRRALTVAATAGEAIDSLYGGTDIGETVTSGAAAQGDKVEKNGSGYAALKDIPVGTRTLAVNAGTLALRPTAAPVRRYEVAIPNGDFSNWGGNEGKYGNVYAAYGGWSCSGVAAFYHYDDWFTKGGGPLGSTVLITAYGFDVCPPLEGKCVLILKVIGAKAQVAGVVFSEPGEYELSYLMTSRDTTSQRSRVRNYLTDADGKETYIGTASSLSVKKWEDQKTMRFSVAKAGTYTLHFDHVTPWYDGTTGRDAAVLINSLHLYRVGDTAVAWKIPGGDFENVTGTTDGNVGHFNGTAGVDGWTFDTTVVSTYVRSGVATAGSYCEAGRRWGSGYNCSHAPLGGERQLLIRRSEGFATATFTPPKGTWYLKARMALWGEYSDANGGPTLTATVAATGAEAVNLGALPVPKCWTMLPYVWPQPFEADGATEVTLTLTFATSSGVRGVHLDDFELVGEYQCEHEILVNGDFETPHFKDKDTVGTRTGWAAIRATVTTVTNQTTGASKTSTVGDGIARQYGRDNWAFGADYGSGECFYEPYNQGGVGGVCQDVKFPHAGWYRLTYLAKTRVGAGVSQGLVDIVLIDTATSVTNVIDSINRLSPGVFSQRTALFRVDAACMRRLAVLCRMNSYTHPAFDDFSIRYVGKAGEGALASPDPEEKGLIVNLATGARLQLDFAGTNVVSRLTVNGTRQAPGVYGAANCESIYGAGSLLVQPRNVGAVLIVK